MEIMSREHAIQNWNNLVRSMMDETLCAKCLINEEHPEPDRVMFAYVMLTDWAKAITGYAFDDSKIVRLSSEM
jgi:hypothetical protein